MPVPPILSRTKLYMVDSVKSINKCAISNIATEANLSDQFTVKLNEIVKEATSEKNIIEIDRFILSGLLTYELAAGSFENDMKEFIQKIEYLTGESFNENGDYSRVDIESVSQAFIQLLQNK